ncbi:TetR/AcrR family transcriptional regulator [Mycobacterium shimoidei]|uniref:TetR family transcriptional regulator [Amycolicicoccus subflavus DQS3-9A1] n=1 Tax=Mycobacterium shimoidei TaxID=29313 RepID=A0A1E3TIS5_MYCSH|nr:TetR family transcriptional regulator [Mycobacterium shimoidei]MCV7257334.1 TetR/AcrR family transcriptional regulator [Mycobacterium shimoidei]ODR14335.1 TetR family transcriptional regulator [Mycobacterium shimoidei]ORW80412.1 TetR family transcriptional regulator [Mycobacterium shimoidei]SRX95975.1 TetR family transcriptional regulator [Amycolicicoccus subflavus DQS3-9A1] [Mycobacterium shimoidei]
MAGTARTYGGATQSERRSRRQAVLLDAALDLVADVGVGALTVRGVCSRARLNDRYFYESYRNVDELVLAMLDDQIGRAFDKLLPAIEATPPDPVLRARAAIGSGLDFLADDPRRGRLLIQSQATDGLRARRLDLIRMLAKVMADQGRALLSEQDSLDPDIDLAAFTLVAGGFDLVTLWLRDELDVGREHLEDFLVTMVTGGRRDSNH